MYFTSSKEYKLNIFLYSHIFQSVASFELFIFVTEHSDYLISRAVSNENVYFAKLVSYFVVSKYFLTLIFFVIVFQTETLNFYVYQYTILQRFYKIVKYLFSNSNLRLLTFKLVFLYINLLLIISEQHPQSRMQKNLGCENLNPDNFVLLGVSECINMGLTCCSC